VYKLACLLTYLLMLMHFELTEMHFVTLERVYKLFTVPNMICGAVGR